jgi:hypothetical protein
LLTIDSLFSEIRLNTILTIDIAHPPMRAAEAEAALNEALRKVQLSPTLRILKIVHGYGSSGRGGSLKMLVKDFCYKNRSRIHQTFSGENFSLFDYDVQDMLKECNLLSTALDGANEGVTIVRVK